MKKKHYLIIISLLLIITSCLKSGTQYTVWRNITKDLMITKDNAYLYRKAKPDSCQEGTFHFIVQGEIYNTDSVSIIKFGHCISQTDSFPTFKDRAEQGGDTILSDYTDGFLFTTVIRELDVETGYFVRSYCIAENISSGRIDTGYSQLPTRFFTTIPQDIWFHNEDFNEKREEGVAFVLKNDGVINGYIGLGFDGIAIKKDFWEYDPVADTWQNINTPLSSNNGLMSAVAFVLKDRYKVQNRYTDYAYVGTGISHVGNHTITREMYEYRPQENQWKTIEPLPENMERYNGVAFAMQDPNGKWFGYVGLGKQNPESNRTDMLKYDFTRDTTDGTSMWAWEMLPSNPYLYGVGLTEAVAAVIGNHVIIGSGQKPDGSYSNDFFSWYPDAGGNGNNWGGVNSCPGEPRANAVAFTLSFEREGLDNNLFYLATGRGENDTLFNDVWALDIIQGRWTQKSNMIDYKDSVDVAPSREGAVAFSMEKSIVEYGVHVRGFVLTGRTSDTEGNRYFLKDVWEYLP